jgi:hypothetical protein
MSRPLVCPAPRVVGGLLGLLLAGCAPGTPPAPPPPPAEIPVAPSATASTPPPAARPAAEEATRPLVVTSTPLPEDLDQDTGPAPCDFRRTYRGTVGKTPLTWSLHPAAAGSDQVEGSGHYDRPGPAFVLTGTRTAASGAFVVSEKAGGVFRGECDAKGTLKGEFSLQGKKTPFELRARPAGWPPLYRTARHATQEPNHPLCKKQAKRDQMVVTSESDTGPEILCLPTNPVKKKELLTENDFLLCAVDERAYRVFGLADPAVEKRVNEQLGSSLYDAMRDEIRACHHRHRFFASSSLVWAGPDLLVVSGFHSDDQGGAHPMNNSDGSRAIDLRSGASIALDQILDPAALRPLAGACLPLYEATSGGPRTVQVAARLPPVTCSDEPGMARYLWGCSPDDRQDPAWTLLPAGIVIGAWGNPHVTAATDGWGPIVPWSVLRRAGILRANSPVAHLWAGVPAAGPTDLPCEGAYEGGSLLAWRGGP